MAYSTHDEIANFDFSESTIVKVTVTENQLDIRCGDVMIPTSNSQNTDVEKMGTDELRIRMKDIQKLEVKKDGYRIYNLDDTVREDIPDRVIPKEEWNSLFESLEGQAIYSITKENDCYVICIDTAETEVSYTVSLEAQSDLESWEDHHRLPAYLRG